MMNEFDLQYGPDINIEDLTQCCSYVFALSPEPRVCDKLSDMRQFLVSQDDVSVLDKIILYDVPHIFTVLFLDGGAAFLYIAAFAGRLKKGTDFKPLAVLAPYHKIINHCNIPYLGALLFNGAFFDDKYSYNIMSNDDAVTLALSCEDFFVIHGQPGTGKTTMIKDMINALAGRNDEASSRSRYASAAHYQKWLSMQNKPDYAFVDQVKHAKMNFQHFIFAKKSVVNALESLLDMTAAYINRELLKEIMRLIEQVRSKSCYVGPAQQRLLKSIYSLPRNRIVYEDNGENVIKEAIIRLKKDKNNAFAISEAAQLENLLNEYNDSDNWFEKMNTIRKKLLLQLTPKQNEYISNEEKKQILDLYDHVIEALTLQANLKLEQANAVLIDFMNEIPNHSKIIDTYIKDVDFSLPIVCGGVVIIDMDACTDEGLIIDAIAGAKKIILLSAYEDGLFNIFFKAAMLQEKKDHKIRAALLAVNYRQDPKIAEFISFNFYEKKGCPKVQCTNIESTDAQFIWFEESTRRDGLIAHIFESASQSLSIAVIAFEESEAEKMRQTLEAYGSNAALNCIQTGIESDFCSMEFDIVYLLHAHTISDEKRLCAAMSRARKKLVIVGCSVLIKEESPLQNFYYICCGDDHYGKLYC